MYNIIRFNWHFYAGAAFGVLLLLLLAFFLGKPFAFWLVAFACLLVVLVFLSLVVSFYVYDLSRLYRMDWLPVIDHSADSVLVNIHAGFDETSSLFHSRFPNETLLVFDFYDPLKHTEVSIKRARKAYPPYPGTLPVSTKHLPLKDGFATHVFVFFSAHEIRAEQERIGFFKEAARVLKPGGSLLVLEHLRDGANFCAYNIGFLHFHSKATWLHTFYSAGLMVTQKEKITPFTTLFVLTKNGITS